MFADKIFSPAEVPIPEKSRKRTDCCCTIIGALFALTMFIAACCFWDRDGFDEKLDYDTS